MKETISMISLILGVISVALIILMNLTTYKKLKKAEATEKAIGRKIKLGAEMENTPFGEAVLEKLDKIEESQNLFSRSLLHILRTDLLNVTDEILYINRKRNTVGSKWSSLEVRLQRYAVLEEIMDACFESYQRLGGNHYVADRYRECKAVIKETQRQSED